MRTVLSVSLTERMADELEAYSKSTGRNKSDIVKESLSVYLWEARFRETRKRLASRAKKLGIVTEEDVFRTVS